MRAMREALAGSVSYSGDLLWATDGTRGELHRPPRAANPGATGRIPSPVHDEER